MKIIAIIIENLIPNIIPASIPGPSPIFRLINRPNNSPVIMPILKKILIYFLTLAIINYPLINLGSVCTFQKELAQWATGRIVMELAIIPEDYQLS